jgi:hypothetical protein
MMIPLLVVQSVVGILWAFTAFRTLFHLWGRGIAMAGSAFMGPRIFLRCVRDWLRDPAERRWRWRLAILTVATLALSVSSHVVGPQSTQ